MIKVIPRAASISVEQDGDKQYRVRLTSPPVDGAANSQLIEVLAKKLSVAPRCVEITRGETSRIKQVKITGVDPKALSRLMLAK